MLLAGLELMGEIPFPDVNIHATINAPDGRRMSKSLGTGIDPLELIDEHGADATRYGLLKMSSTQDVRSRSGRSPRDEACEQALERGSADARQRGGRHPRRAASRRRGALDPRPHRRDSGRARALIAEYDFAPAVGGSTA